MRGKNKQKQQRVLALFLYLWYKEVNRTKPSPFVRLP